MSPPWLQRLNHATEYRELQTIFAEIAADARATPQDPQLVECIDEAVRRIQKESLRDEDDLDLSEDEYEHFKRQHRGFFGWLRRHLPFTKTWRTERRFIAAVTDRRAQMLANQLIIARAQMMKEELLPSEKRRLGHTVSEWQRRLSECDSLARLQDYASHVRQLQQELNQSQAFVTELDAQLDAFADARFSNEEDRRRKDADLSTARSELSMLHEEIQREESLRGNAIRRLGEIVSDELTSHDASYRALLERISLLQTATQSVKNAEESFQKPRDVTSSMCKMADELESIPERRNRLIGRLPQLERDLEDARRRHQRAAAEQAEQASRYERAKDDMGRAQAAVEAAQDVYKAHLAETGQVEMPISDTSAVAVECTRRRDELKEAEAALRTMAAPYEAAKTEVQRVERDVAALDQKLNAVRQEEEDLVRRSRQLRTELDSAHDQLRRLTDPARADAEEYLASLRSLDLYEMIQEFDRIMPSGDWGSSPLVPNANSERELKESEELYRRALKSLQDARNSLDRTLYEDRQQQQSAWTRRCTELLGEDLSAVVCQQ